MKAISLVLCMVLLMVMPCIVDAKDYSEKIGPYEVSFKLPDEIASTIEVNKTITRGETLDGTPYNMYSIGLPLVGWIEVRDFNRTWELDLDKMTETMKGLGKGNGYTCSSAHRIIDDREGVISYCFGSERYTTYYEFAYQQDNHTTVEGRLYLDWEATLPFLKSLHVREL